MKVIWKYTLTPSRLHDKQEQELEIPSNSKLLKTVCVDETLILYYLVDPNEERIKKCFKYVMTGEEFEYNGLDYIDSIITDRGLVVHWFQEWVEK